MKPRICWHGTAFAFPITLMQEGPDKFKVAYGKQFKDNLDYSQAAHELGCCIMHALACEGQIVQREPEHS